MKQYAQRFERDIFKQEDKKMKNDTIKTIEFTKVNNLFASKDDAMINHKSWTSWVSPDLKNKTSSSNNIGPQGWLKVVDDKQDQPTCSTEIIESLLNAVSRQK